MPVRRFVARLRDCKKETVPMLQRIAAIVAAVVIAATLPGLLAAQADHAPAQTSNDATVCIFQPAGSGFGTTGVYLDGDYIGTLHGGRYFCFALAPGQHSFVGATSGGKFWKGSLTATLASGGLYYLESSTAYKRFKPAPNRHAFKEQSADFKDLGSSAKVRWVSLPLPGVNVNRQAASPAPVTSPPSPAVASVDARQLEAKYPDADLAVQEVSQGIYEFTVLKGNVKIGSISFDQGGPALTMAPSYLGKNLVFIGNITNFVGAASRDMRSRTINAASLSYDPSVQVNPPLADLGVVALNDSGIVKSDTAKSGWINWTCTVKFDDSGRTRTVRIENISFWVNRGGENWLSFSIGKAHEVRTDGTLGAEVPVTAKLERDGANGSVTILVEDKYPFRPSIEDSQTLAVMALRTAPPGATTAAGQENGAVPANHPDVRAGAGPTASNDATMTGSPTKVVHDYLLAAATTDASARKLFLSATCAVDIADEFSANLKSGWTFSETDLSLTNDGIDSASGKASVSAQVVYKGGNPPTFMATSHTFFLVQEGGLWKISAINPPPARGGPGVSPL